MLFAGLPFRRAALHLAGHGAMAGEVVSLLISDVPEGAFRVSNSLAIMAGSLRLHGRGDLSPGSWPISPPSVLAFIAVRLASAHADVR